MVQPWFQMDAEEALRRMESSREGLTAVEAERRLRQQGPNILTEEDRSRIGPILLRQFMEGTGRGRGSCSGLRDAAAFFVLTLLPA